MNQRRSFTVSAELKTKILSLAVALILSKL
jgi:hypothetical protein